MHNIHKEATHKQERKPFEIQRARSCNKSSKPPNFDGICIVMIQLGRYYINKHIYPNSLVAINLSIQCIHPQTQSLFYLLFLIFLIYFDLS